MEHTKTNVYKKKKKICLISSSGGHFEQLRMLDSLSIKYDLYYVTEKTIFINEQNKTYYIRQVNRHEIKFLLNMFVVFVQSIKVFFMEKPDIIISTGALSVIPTFIIGKLFGKKLIFIESYAKVNSPTLTGKLLYKICDIFIIQWKSLNKFYPKAVFLGSIY